jgi:hypothetical protein
MIEPGRELFGRPTRTLPMMTGLDQLERGGEAGGGTHEAPAAERTADPRAAQVAQHLVATHGRSVDALAAGVRASGLAHDPALWAALQQLVGMAIARQVQAQAAAGGPAAASEGASPPPPDAGAATVGPTTAPGLAPGVTPAVTPAAATAAAPPYPISAEPREVTISGVRVVAPAGTHVDVIEQCRTFIEQLVGRNAHAQRRFQRQRVTIVVIPANTPMTSLPQFRSLRGDDTFDGRDWSTVRGSGGTRSPDGSFSIGIGEETLVTIPGATASNYPRTFSVGMHELAHTLHSKGLTRAQRSRLSELYRDHARRDPGNANGTWTDNYASANDDEYFAQSTNAFFGTNQMGTNHNGREWIAANDPEMYAFLVSVYEANTEAEGDEDDAEGGRRERR